MRKFTSSCKNSIGLVVDLYLLLAVFVVGVTAAHSYFG